LKRELGDPLPFDLSFAPPNGEFKPVSTTRLMLDCFLFDIREETALRNNAPLVRKLPGGQIEIEPPPFRATAHYCLTAWSPAQEASGQKAADEHALLGQVLQAIARHAVVPQELLQGALIGQSPPPPLVVGGPSGLLSPPDFWSAVGGRLRPSLELAVTVALTARPPAPGERVTSIVLDMGAGEQTCQIGGEVTGPDEAGAVSLVTGAWVSVGGVALQVRTQADGRFVMSGVSRGKHVLRVRATGFRDTEREIDVPGSNAEYDVHLDRLA
jgi:hypothetical protein